MILNVTHYVVTILLAGILLCSLATAGQTTNVNILDQAAMRGGQCYESPILDSCPANTGPCQGTMCDLDPVTSLYECPQDTHGFHNVVDNFSSGCSAGDFGYDNCVQQGFVCYQHSMPALGAS
mgnify:CR=1 FL=1